MSLVINLPSPLEAEVNAAACREGISPSEWMTRFLLSRLPTALGNNPDGKDPLIALFEQWKKEDASMTPEEIAKEQREFEEFKTNINAERDRAGARRVF